MPRENSISDEADGRSLTPDLDEERAPKSPTYSNAAPDLPNSSDAPKRSDSLNPKSLPSLRIRKLNGRSASHLPPALSPRDRFRATVRKVMQLHRTTTLFSTYGVGAEPGVDPRRNSANLAYGHIHENCVIEICDYSSVHASFGKMTNQDFVDFMNDPTASAKEPWVKVRWINIRGISWDVISAVAVKYGKL
jgi:hypothetical protein